MITKTLLELVKKFEGCSLEAYQDVVGVWTIGYGTTGDDVYDGLVWSQEKADARLTSDLEEFQDGVRHLVKVSVSQNQLDALTCFAYNVGLGALGHSTLLRLLNAKDYRGAAEQFLRWNKAGGKVYAGLTRRREAEKALFLKV